MNDIREVLPDILEGVRRVGQVDAEIERATILVADADVVSN